ncbi:unnamed protein product, partial [Medioppia subpectinata]
GVSDELIAKVKTVTQEYELTKAGDVYTQTLSGNNATAVKFELGKEFDEIRPDGKSVKSLVVADGNKLIQTQKGDQEIKYVREFNGTELKTTITYGPVVAVRVYNKV